MSKNLYWLKCSTQSEWDIETAKAGKPALTYINLYPGSYNTLHQAKKAGKGIVYYATNDSAYFWQKPD
jgi:nucleoside-diphosphate-sugar epimerase